MKSLLRSSVLFLLCLFHFPAEATQVLPLTGHQLVQYANVIADVTYLGNENISVADPKTGKPLPATRYQFHVEECLKGDCGGDSLSFVQFGVDRREANGANRLFVIGIPELKVGKEYVICLSAPGFGTGFRSFIGLGQGKFEVQKNVAGQKMLLNDFSNEGLLEGSKPVKGMKASDLPSQGPISYDNFKNMIQQSVPEKK